MTALLKKALAKAADLPKTVQNELAKQLLEDIEAELKWDRTPASPKSQKLLAHMAKKVLKARRAGKTYEMGFDEL
ncbi:MAG: hypothetical protein ACTHN5_05845 [Phycisphaerae bacterium]